MTVAELITRLARLPDQEAKVVYLSGAAAHIETILDCRELEFFESETGELVETTRDERARKVKVCGLL